MTDHTAPGVFETPLGALGFWPVDTVPGSENLSVSHLILLENLLRHEDSNAVSRTDIAAIAEGRTGAYDVAFHPSRVFLHDTNGVPVLTDLAAMRDAFTDRGLDPVLLDTHVPAHLTVDHSVVTDYFHRPDAPRLNVAREYERNDERYRFLKWGEQAFSGLKVVPPGAGIMHQVNVEYLASVVEVRDGLAFPDTVAGTDSHTTMVNGLAVLAWGVGGIEAEAAMLGEPISTIIPPIVGIELTGTLRPGVTATDLVLTLTERLRALGVVGNIVEFFGASVGSISLATRCTIANMSPEFGSTAAMFPVDAVTIDFLLATGRSRAHAETVELYARRQGLWHDPSRPRRFDRHVTVDLDEIAPSIAGPRRPQDRVTLTAAPAAAAAALAAAHVRAPLRGDTRGVPDGAVAIASLTSCTNTSNPAVMIAAGLLARNAVAYGLRSQPWVKTSLAPGSKVVTDYLARAGLLTPLETLGFGLVGYGCMTCIGNSGDLLPEVGAAIRDDGVVVASVLSGNRNFDGRINNDVGMNFLASPPLVIAYALAGRMDVDVANGVLGYDAEGAPVTLSDIWPTDQEIEDVARAAIDADMYVHTYAHIFDGDANWRALPASNEKVFAWDSDSTYLRRPPFLDLENPSNQPLTDARALLVLEDSVTTDHICPAGRVPLDSPAGRHLTERGVPASELSSFAARRGNWEVMTLGGFSNRRLPNRLAPSGPGGYTRDATAAPDAPTRDVAAVAASARDAGIPLVVLAGREYGTGSSRDWAAKVTRLLGVRAVIAESFERIHRSNLVGMGVLPLQFAEGDSIDSLGLDGTEAFSIAGIGSDIDVPRRLEVSAVHPETGRTTAFAVRTRIDTPLEHRYFRAGGVLPYALERALARATQPQSHIATQGPTLTLTGAHLEAP